jgi:RNA polymerase sigma-32 factor
LVEQIAWTFRAHGVSTDDLVQEGFVGLFEAIRRFDPERGLRLSTYAQYWIRATLHDLVYRQASAVRPARRKDMPLAWRLRRERRRLEATLGEDTQVIDEALAQRSGATLEKVRQLDTPAGRVVSLDEPREGGGTRADTLADPEPLADERVGSLDLQGRVREALDSLELSPRERAILDDRLLAESANAATLSEIASRFGVSRERIRQIEERLVERAREALRPLKEAV